MSTLAVCILLPFFLFAQFPFENPTVLNAENGLPSDQILDVAQDENGVTWIGTDKGLVRFDGLTMEIFQSNPGDSTSLLSHGIQQILPDGENGKVWLATNRGLSVLNQKTKHFKNYVHDPADPSSVPDHKILSVFKDMDGQIWMGVYERGIARFRPETDDFEQYICQGDLRSGSSCDLSANEIVADFENDSILWLASKGITRFNRIDGSFQNFKFETDDMALDRYANGPTNMVIRPNGKIYYGTWYHGVYVMDTKTLTISRFDPKYLNGTFPYEEDVVLNFFPISENRFWINSWGGTQLYDTRSNSILKAYNNSQIEDKWQGFDHIDGLGRIWNYSTDMGIRIYNPLMQQYEFLQYDDEDSPYHSNTRRILEDTIRKRIYVAASGASQGLHYFDQIKNEWHLILPPKGKMVGELKGANLVDIALLENGDVIALSDSIFWYEQGGVEQLKRYPVQPKEEVIRFRGCIVDSEGMVWLGAWSGGFYRLDHEKKKLHSFREELEPFSEKTLGGDHMAEDIRGNIWMRENFSLLIWERSTGQFIHHPYDPENLKSLRGMGRITATEDGRVWVACNSEFLGYGHADSLDRGIIRFLGREEGLIGSHVYLAKKHRDKLLVFTDKGMQFFDPHAMRFGKLFDYGYGLGNEPVFNATWLKDGRLAVCRRKSIALFHPDSLRTNEERPVPYITSFRIFDEVYDLNSDPIQSDSICLNYTQNFFSFEFSAIGYNLPDRTSFEYKLEGFDEKWQNGTERRFAAYTNVPGGDYIFKIRAKNNEGLSHKNPNELFIHISTVWYKTVWFWCLALLFFSIIGYLIYRWRIAQVRKEERLRSEYERQLADVEMSALRAQMNPHFIFNSLNSIEYYIITNEPEKAVDYLGRFSKLIRLILQNSKNSIVPLKDVLEALRLYIEMESLRFDNLFDYEVKMENDINTEKVVVPPMLMQPYVENAIWHGLMQKREGKGKLDLTLRRSNGHLICSIEDNGIGREEAQKLKSKSATKRKSYGMKITSDRLAMLNKLAGADASVKIYDLKNEEGKASGTRVELVIPL